MKDIETIVSENIQKLLKEYNINQTELAKIADVSVSTVGKWILKKATPRMGAIQKISDHFNLPKSYILEEEEIADNMIKELIAEYNYIPAEISAGLPNDVEGITEYEKISIPDKLMGKHAGDKSIYISRINGASMNNVIPDGSLIAIKPVSLENLKNGDIVVYNYDNEYAVKRYYHQGDKIVFKPDSNDNSFNDQVIYLDDDVNIKIKGKVILYIVELD